MIYVAGFVIALIIGLTGVGGGAIMLWKAIERVARLIPFAPPPLTHVRISV